MTWHILHKPAYDTDFIDLPKDLQRQATRAHAELAQDPVTPRGNTIKKLKGWENLWRYRLGDYRLIYAVGKNAVQLLAIGPRKDVYARFERKSHAEDGILPVFAPDLEAQLKPRENILEWQKHPEWMLPKREKPRGEPLPRKLSPALLSKWLIPEDYHPALMRCRTDDELQAADVPDSVLGRVMDALWPPSVEKIAAQPDRVLVNPEDLERYAEGTLRTFLLHLDDKQRRYVDWALKGPTLVKGGPGSGKSTIALYRVRSVLEHAREVGEAVPEILFTTYTNPLINFSESLLRQLFGLSAGEKLPTSIKITTVDKIVFRIVKQSGLKFDLAEEKELTEALHHARASVKPAEPGDLEQLMITRAIQDLRDDYLLEEFEWIIEGQNCRTEEDYLAANRAGRGIPFSRKTRRAVWKLYHAYRKYLLEDRTNHKLTWGILRQLALRLVQTGKFIPKWDNVIVDEAQDLTPAALALCVELCRDPAGIFLTADANQSLYNRGFSWKSVHTQLNLKGRTRILRRNYRSTRDLAEAARDVLAPTDLDRQAAAQEYIHAGPPPAVYAANGAADQAQWLAQQIYLAAKDLHLPLNAAAVLVPSNSLGPTMARWLNENGLPAKYMKSKDVNLDERKVKVLTLHSAKGLEFPIVAIAHVEVDRLPKETRATDAQEVEEHLSGQRRLMYVGCTRAMRYLFVTYDRSLPSPFIQDLSEEHWMFMNDEE